MSTEKTEMGFLQHLEALRWHLMRSTIAIVVLAVTAFFFNEFIFGTVIFGPKNPDFITYRALCKGSHMTGLGDALCIEGITFDMINTELSGQFTMHMWVSFVLGLIIASPYVLWELWCFIKPALSDKEKSKTRGFVFFSSLLFLMGVFFSYYVIVPLTVNFLGNYHVSADVKNTITMDSYISTLSTLTLASGLIFELPILIYFLTKFGLASPPTLRKFRKHAAIVILIVAAIITPSSDIVTQLIVAAPLFILYEASIFVSAYAMKNQQV